MGRAADPGAPHRTDPRMHRGGRSANLAPPDPGNVVSDGPRTRPAGRTDHAGGRDHADRMRWWAQNRAMWCCAGRGDRKSTRLNSSHVAISYAVFCLKKKTPDDT